MRIGLNLLYLLPGVVGGTQTYAECLVDALVRAGTEHEIVLFVNRRGAVLRWPDSERLRVVPCPLDGDRRVSRYAWEQAILPVWAARHRVDVLHSLGYVAPVTGRAPGVVTVHDVNFLVFGSDMGLMRRAGLELFVRAAVRHCARVITVSEAAKADIVTRLHVPPDKVVAIHEAPSPRLRLPPRDDPLRRFGIHGPYVLALSGASPNKNIPRLVRAFARVAAKVPHRLVVAGYVPAWPSLASSPKPTSALSSLERTYSCSRRGMRGSACPCSMRKRPG
jgi:glycosyltransferase involved in cell wall biosynthesis